MEANFNNNSATKPAYNKTSYNCPHCHTLTQMIDMRINTRTGAIHASLREQVCHSCGKSVLWHYDKMVFPITYDAPLPHPDMPVEILKEFEEARSLYELSPKCACLILRMCLKKLSRHLGSKGTSLDDDLSFLITKGLPSTMKKAFEIVRVCGEQAVPAGTLEERDNRETALSLFNLINMTIKELITKPKEIENLYNMMPKGTSPSFEKIS